MFFFYESYFCNDKFDKGKNRNCGEIKKLSSIGVEEGERNREHERRPNGRIVKTGRNFPHTGNHSH